MSNIIEQANRCLKCKVPACSKGCPVATPIPDIIQQFLAGELQQAGAVLFANNPLTSICAQICPHEKNCMGHCILGKKGVPVEFFPIEEYISKFYLDTYQPPQIQPNGYRVGVLGAGPAGLTAAILLALDGFHVSLIEAKEQIGGVLRYGIPEFRLPKAILDRYQELIIQLGIKFRPNTTAGVNIDLDDMFLDGYDAIFLAIGVGRPNKLGFLGETLGTVHYAIDYLKSPDSYHLGRKVVVIGAGNVAMDAARVAIRKSHAEVTILNYKGPAEMTGNQQEIAMAQIDGVQFRHYLQPIKIEEDGVVCAKVEVVENADGTKEFVENFKKAEKIPADAVIIAIGQGPLADRVIGQSKVTANSWGLLETDENGRTNKPGVFAAGDAVTGPKTVVEAVAFAKRAVSEIKSFCYAKGK